MVDSCRYRSHCRTSPTDYCGAQAHHTSITHSALRSVWDRIGSLICDWNVHCRRSPVRSEIPVGLSRWQARSYACHDVGIRSVRRRSRRRNHHHRDLYCTRQPSARWGSAPYARRLNRPVGGLGAAVPYCNRERKGDEKHRNYGTPGPFTRKLGTAQTRTASEYCGSRSVRTVPLAPDAESDCYRVRPLFGRCCLPRLRSPAHGRRRSSCRASLIEIARASKL